MLITEHGEDEFGLPMDTVDFKDCQETSLTTAGDVAFSLDADCDINQDDFLQQLPIDLEIPMLMGEENISKSLLEESDCLEPIMSVNSSNFDGLVDLDDLDLHKWVPHTFPNSAAFSDGFVCNVKEEIKSEPPPSPPSSVSSLSSLSEGVTSPGAAEGTVDIKVILETPPISPPREDLPVLGTPCTLMSTNVGTILPTAIISAPQPCIIPAPQIPKISKGVKVIRPKISSSQLQTRNTLSETEGSKSSQPAIIFSAKEFVALANQMKKGKSDPTNRSVTLVSGLPSTPISEKTLVSVASAAPTIASQVGNSKADIEQAKAMKRQQRMIKNRESACLSRKKKKEYVATLEEQLAQLRKENEQLKMENMTLRKYLGDFGMEVKCEEKGVWLGSSPPLSPKSPFSSLDSSSSPIFSANTKKVTAFFAILLVVSLNIGPFGGLLQNDQLSSHLRQSRNSGPVKVMERSVPHSPDSAAVVPGIYSSGRALLWSLGKGELPSLDSEEDEEVSGPDFVAANTSMPHPTCPLPINATESIRLDNELRGWFGKESWMAANFSASEKGGSVLKGPHSWLVPPQSTPLPLRENSPSIPRVSRKPLPSLETFAQNRMKKKGSKLRQWPLGNPSMVGGREVAVYSQRSGSSNSRRDKYEFSDLLEAIGRREDRFYVVSFSGDHILLPASVPALNASHQPPRPKMTLLLPAVMPNGSVNAPLDHITMMQIDCEVTDTQLMTVRQGVIPSHLRGKSSGSTSHQAPTAPCNNGTQGLRKASVPFNPYLQQEGRGRL